MEMVEVVCLGCGTVHQVKATGAPLRPMYGCVGECMRRPLDEIESEFPNRSRDEAAK